MFDQEDIPSRLTALRATHNMGRTIIFETVYGSRLYGCSTESSDNDIRGVFLPGLHDFLTDRHVVPQPLIPEANLGESDDIVHFPVGQFVTQVMRMKVNCVEIYFAALAQMRRGAEIHPAMRFLLDQKDRLIVSDPAGFVGHARQRASGYVDGEDRNDLTLQANRHALDELQHAAGQSAFNKAKRICDIDGLAEAIASHPLIDRDTSKAGDSVLLINARQLPENTRIGEAIITTEQRIARFMKKADTSDKTRMFKELYTALRMMETAVELMETGEISFPCRRAGFYAKVRAGEIAPEAILELIDAAQHRAVEIKESGNTPLPDPLPSDDYVVLRDEIVAELRYMALSGLEI